MGTEVISVHQLVKSFGKKEVLKGLSFSVTEGSIFALLGENGAGKTTTIRILSTLMRADSGVAYVGGYECSKDPNQIKKRISFTGQYATVDELLSGEENLWMMGRLYHLDKATTKQRTAELIQQFDLADAAKRQVKTYSGGMRRRLDIAISLLATPKVIFLDEPTTGLDPRSRMRMWEIIKELSQQGVTILLTTQYLEEAERLAQTIAVINEGRIVAEGSADDLKALVGQEKIELTFKDEHDLFNAQALLKGHIQDSKLLLEVMNTGSADSLRQCLNQLHDVDLQPSTLHVRKPTLDDVFMKITEKA